jgi:hypothetical protein
MNATLPTALQALEQSLMRLTAHVKSALLEHTNLRNGKILVLTVLTAQPPSWKELPTALNVCFSAQLANKPTTILFVNSAQLVHIKTTQCPVKTVLHVLRIM